MADTNTLPENRKSPATYADIEALPDNMVGEMLEVFELVDDKWQIAATYKDADQVAAPPFEAHTFSLDALWEPDDTISEPQS